MRSTAGELFRRVRHGSRLCETREITVHRTFDDFDDFWMTEIKSPAVAPVVDTMASGDAEKPKSRVCARLPADTEGRIIYGTRAHAIKGHLPK